MNQHPLQVRFPFWGLWCHLVTNIAAYQTDPRHAAEQTALAAQVDRLYIRDWERE